MSSVREWLFSKKSRGMALGLDRVTMALEALNRPDRDMDCIHVAGSNGKGSACAQLVMGLVRAGYRVGFFSSPHLVDIEERVRVDGKSISSDDFDRALQEVKDLNVDLTFFEITYLVSLVACRDAGASIMVLETGLGGRLDATRSADVVGCLVTSVSLEHTEILGDTIEKVAKEKAAIWRPGVPMLIRDPGSPRVRNAMRDEAISARFYTPEKSTFMDEAADLAEHLCAMIGYSFVRRPIQWPGRMQLIKGNPSILLESAHNPSGMQRAIPEIERLLPKKWSLLFGTSPQKDMEEFIEPLIGMVLRKPPVDIITTEPQRGRYPGVKNPIDGLRHIKDPIEGLKSLKENCDFILVTGSLYLCGNILSYLEIGADIV